MAQPNAAPDRRAQSQRPGVTRREAEVLDLVLDVYRNGDIAHRLGISKRTVESHLAALLRKYGVTDRAELIRAASPPPGNRADRRSRSARVSGAKHAGADAAAEAAAEGRRRVAAQRQQAAHLRAVLRERQAIVVHEAAAQRLDTIADAWHERARATPDREVCAVVLDHADSAHRRAEAARSRAREARRRLLAEGIDPDPKREPVAPPHVQR